MELRGLSVAATVLLAAPGHPFNEPAGEDPSVVGQQIDQALASSADALFVTCVHRASADGAHRVLHREPVCARGEWSAPFDPAVLGLDAGQVHPLNNDRVGRASLSLFDADRASLLNETVLRAVAEFSIDCSQLHDDSTSVKLTGVYAGATGVTRGSKPTVVAKRGHSKDHRPDLLTELPKEFSR